MGWHSGGGLAHTREADEGLQAGAVRGRSGKVVGIAESNTHALLQDGHNQPWRDAGVQAAGPHLGSGTGVVVEADPGLRPAGDGPE